MKKLKFLTIYISIAVAAVLFAGCRKYLDVNQDPNVARNVTPALLLSSGQVAMASALGVDMNINGSIWGQYWTQATNSSQYKVLEQYLPNATEYDREWSLLYNSALADFRRMETIAREQNMDQYVAVSKLMQAYTFQLITDAWGDVPFSEALRGEPSEGGIQAPRFDKQEAIYDGLLVMIDSALALIDPSADIHPGVDDLIYHGDMTSWERFGNTLKLKIGLRMSEVNPAKAQAAVASAYASGGVFIDEQSAAQISFISTAGNQNPLYSQIVGLNYTQNLVASATVVDSMRSNDDWRRFAVFTPIGADVVGLGQGNYNASASIQVSFPSAVTGAEARNTSSAEAPIKLFTAYESYFLQAEAAARGWGGTGDQELFESGIEASFAEYADEIAGLEVMLIDSPEVIALTAGLAAELYIHGGTITGYNAGEPDTFTAVPAYWGQYPSGGTVAEKVRHIITQKWFALTGTQGFEAWTEWRRTGYPDFFVISANSIIGNVFPGSFLYPNAELTRNRNFPGQKQVTTKVWWDVN